MINEIKQDAKQRMERTITALRTELTKLRTGRAHPSILDHVKVDYYGSDVPISQVAGVSIQDARTLAITPWEKEMVGPIEKAIMTSDLGLNPATAGTVIRLPMPMLTEERRRDMVKLVNAEAEKSRVSIRNIRREANSDLKELQKEKEISEDEERRGQEDVQKLTDTFIAQVEEVASNKEKELMEI